MCGIFGCLKLLNSNIDIKNLIIIALNLLKNRGYDSCGIYLSTNSISNSQIFKFGIDGEIIKLKENKEKTIFDILNEKIKNNLELKNSHLYTIGFGHTRWATHGG